MSSVSERFCVTLAELCVAVDVFLVLVFSFLVSALLLTTEGVVRRCMCRRSINGVMQRALP